MIEIHTTLGFWNYYLSIEDDLRNITRFIDFSDNNLSTYSIELARLLLAASSEIDVTLKKLCLFLDKTKNPNNINDYKNIIIDKCNQMINEEIIIHRYGLKSKPWSNWENGNNPYWWKSHNNVKHERNAYFKEANLKNTINAIGALYIINIYYYKFKFSKVLGSPFTFKETTLRLQPLSTFIKINADYYNSIRIS